jgi:hypothetical protein
MDTAMMATVMTMLRFMDESPVRMFEPDSAG